MTGRRSINAINSDQLDQLYDERDQARQRAADAYGQRDRLRLRVAALAERWQLPGHISMPDAAAEIAEALDREQWAPCPDPLVRVRRLADRWENALAVDKPYARALHAALDGPGPEETDATPAELTADEARNLVDELGLDLYRAQDALAFVGECCDIAEREQRPITAGDVREWLKGARCGRQLAADARAATEATEREKTTRVIDLYERWVKVGPPPLGKSLSRWWDARLVELHNAILPPADQTREQP